MPDNQSVLQKKIAFANSEYVAIVIQLLQECGSVQQLIGETEYATIVNAVTLDANQEMIKKFIHALDKIKTQNFTPT